MKAGMPSEYLTTTDAAKFCSVTRFTIRNWVNSCGLKADKTAGGHRRILRSDLKGFMKEKRADRAREEKISPHAIPRCWEFNFKAADKHNCVNCLAFKERANKCYLILKSFGPEKMQCPHECLDCAYLIRYYPMKKMVIEGAKKVTASRFQNVNRGREDDVPVFFRKGLYTSGKYVASLTRVISRNKKRRRLYK